MKVLITTASEQIWPQIIPVYTLKPNKIIILHTNNASKSKDPAIRLSNFFTAEGLVDEDCVILHEIADTEYPSMLNNSIAADDEIYVNLTGGLKIMSIMLHSWSLVNKAREFYLNEQNELNWFCPNEDMLKLETKDRIPEDVIKEINRIDPIKIAKLYCGEDQIAFEGQKISSSTDIYGISPNAEYSDGVKMEKEVLFTLVGDKKLGEIGIRHSVKLKSKNATNPNEEIDVLLNYNCSLILIECKMRKIASNLRQQFTDMIKNVYKGKKPENSEALQKCVDQIVKYISTNKYMQYKSDIFSARLLTGLKPKVLWVTTEKNLDESFGAFCKENKIEIVHAQYSSNNMFTKETKDRLKDIIKK